MSPLLFPYEFVDTGKFFIEIFLIDVQGEQMHFLLQHLGGECYP